MTRPFFTWQHRKMVFSVAAAMLTSLSAYVIDASAGGGSNDVGNSGKATSSFGRAQLIDVPTSDVRRVAVRVPIAYRSSKSDRAVHRIEKVAVVVSVETPGGGVRNFSARVPLVLDASRSRVFAHPFLSKRGGKFVRRMLEAGRAAQVRATSVLLTDTDKDGKTDDSDRLSRTTAVDQLRSASELAPAHRQPAELPAGYSGSRGSDPCGDGGFDSSCVNVAYSSTPWKAKHFLQSPSPRLAIDCPSGYGIVPTAPAVFGAAPYHQVQTNSPRWTSADTSQNFSAGADITITDDNLTGHPWTYIPWIACCPLSEKVDVSCPIEPKVAFPLRRPF